MGKRAKTHLTPAQRAAMAKMREWLLKSPLLTDLTRMVEQLRRSETEAQTLPQRTRQRQPGGGRPPSFTQDQQGWLQKKYRRDLKANPRLKPNKIAVPHVHELARNRFGIDAESRTLLDQIIRPVRNPK